MADQAQLLQTHFKRFLIEGDENPEDYGDELILGEFWTLKEPEAVEYWIIVLTPSSVHLSFTTKYKNCQTTLPVTLHETVTECSTGGEGSILVSCKTIDPDQEEEYVFSYVVPSKNITFSISATVRSLDDTLYTGLQRNIEEHISMKRWVSKDGGALPHKTLMSRINYVLKGFETD